MDAWRDRWDWEQLLVMLNSIRQFLVPNQSLIAAMMTADDELRRSAVVPICPLENAQLRAANEPCWLPTPTHPHKLLEHFETTYEKTKTTLFPQLCE